MKILNIWWALIISLDIENDHVLERQRNCKFEVFVGEYLIVRTLCEGFTHKITTDFNNSVARSVSHCLES